jgi:bifunctional aspartokinase / homoserine dehydrogenase 1
VSESHRVEVHKFGGTSVGDADRIAAVARIVREASARSRIVVVVSAMAGITDLLVAAGAAAERGERGEGTRLLDTALSRHLEALTVLEVAESASVEAEIRRLVDESLDLIRAVAHLRELTPRTRDDLIAVGEKLSARLVAGALGAAGAAGAAAEAVDADTFLETDDRFGEANALIGVSDRTIAAALRPRLERGPIPVVTGFCGRAPDGATTTLGRGGSDLTATLIAAALRADEVTIWTDVDGVFTADPKVVPGARVIGQLNFREAAEMSYYGAKVLHQRTMIPVASLGIPVRTRNSFTAEAVGTVVDGRITAGSHPVKAVTAVREQCLVSLEGKGMAGVPGIAARLFDAIAGARISVTMISQSSSEASICLAVPGDRAIDAEQILKREFRSDIARSDVDEIVVRRGVSLIAAVGLGMAQTPGIAARVFASLARRGANVLAIAQGSSELSITLAVDRDATDEAIRALHAEFGLDRIDTGEDSERGFDLILLGCGKIGRALAALLHERHDHIVERFGLTARIVAVADRSGFVVRPAGIPRGELTAILEAKAGGATMAGREGAIPTDSSIAMVRHVLAYRLSRPVLVDVTDGEDTSDALLEALRLGCDVVSANKKPLAGSLERFRALVDGASALDRLLKVEATVGAGLPVVDTLEMLIATGDRLTAAEGCLSGTLGFVMTRLEEGAPFSRAVAEAVDLGYTEPDPVADLSGADVGRKAIILGRLSGLAVEGSAITVSGLVDPLLAGRPRAGLIEALAAYDAPLAARTEKARAEGRVLRYVARVEAGRITVGPAEVPTESPLGMLKGTDNMIVFTSERYAARPLVVSGPGAGVDVTAMGVLGDILRIAGERRPR